MNFSVTKFFALLGLGFLSLGPVRAAGEITPEQFAHYHRLMKPTSAEEQWMKIPWMLNLWEARTKAVQQKKPILLWEMDGHPLGCT